MVNDTPLKTCTHTGCNVGIFSACLSCWSLLCYDHFVYGSLCSDHSKKLDLSNSARNIPYETASDNAYATGSSESFTGEGEARQSLAEPESPRKKKRKVPTKEREIRKINRNKGLGYTMQSGKQVPTKSVGPRCGGVVCVSKGFACQSLTDENRSKIFSGFYESGQLQDQRRFMAAYIDYRMPKSSKAGSRKGKSIQYHLPVGTERKQVCRVMFLNTLGISERQVKTVLEKKRDDGQVNPDNRGGRRQTDVERDFELRQSCIRHINKFPRVESHYCRSQTKYQFLSPDLSINTMYDLYCKEITEGKKASKSLYYKTFKSMGLRFHKVKKDHCGICLEKMKHNPQDSSFKEKYQKHIGVKEKARQRKKQKSDIKFTSVLPLPQ